MKVKGRDVIALKNCGLPSFMGQGDQEGPDGRLLSSQGRGFDLRLHAWACSKARGTRGALRTDRRIRKCAVKRACRRLSSCPAELSQGQSYGFQREFVIASFGRAQASGLLLIGLTSRMQSSHDIRRIGHAGHSVGFQAFCERT